MGRMGARGSGLKVDGLGGLVNRLRLFQVLDPLGMERPFFLEQERDLF